MTHALQMVMQRCGANVWHAVYKFNSVQGWKCPIEPVKSLFGDHCQQAYFSGAAPSEETRDMNQPLDQG